MLATISRQSPQDRRNGIYLADKVDPIPPSVQPTIESPGIQIHNDQSPSRSHDGLFFSVEPNSEISAPSYLMFEPVISSVVEREPTDWRRYDAPVELLRTRDDTSDDIKNIVTASVERLLVRYAEEVTDQATAARRVAKPLSRARRVSVRPQRNISEATLDAPSTSNNARFSDASNLSVASFDSGYASRSPDLGPSSESPRATERSSFGLSSIFKLRRKERNQKQPEPSNGGASLPTRSTSQLASTSVTNDQASENASITGECVSCLDDFATPELIKLTCHSYCKDCFQRLISTAMESETHWPVKCCLNTIPSSSILPHLDTQMKKKYSQREAEWSVPIGDRIYCSQPACGTWIPSKNINTQLQSAKCPKCSKQTCKICRGGFHNGSDCPQDPGLQATIDLAEMEGWKRCYSCHALVEHNRGCRHMTCRCKAQFCYICGLKWRTCACTDTQLAEIQERAIAHRHEQTTRDARAAAEAEEERIAIEEVALFIRAEEEREAREAEARRRIEEQERQRRVEERIAAISLRFHQLTNELDLLHDIQRVLMAERHDLEKETIRRNHQNALDTLSIRHLQEVQSLFTESQKIVANAEQQFDTEYQARLTEERRIEDEYVDRLRKYWKDSPEAEYKVREARDELRNEQDKEYKFWNAYRRKQLLAVSERERRRMEGLVVRHKSEVKAVEGRSKIDEVEWRRKREAEGKWVEEVTRERVAMLQIREQAEYASIDVSGEQETFFLE